MGDWEVKNKVNGLKLGDNFIHRVADNNFIIQENWTGILDDYSTGFHYYDSSINKWRHRRIDHRGNTIDFTGIMTKDTLIYHGTSIHHKSKAKTNHRITISKHKIIEIHYLWEQSVNEGPWNVVKNAQYLRKFNPLRGKGKKSIYKYLMESLEDQNHDMMTDLFSKEAIMVVDNEKLISGNQQIKKYYKSFFKQLSSRNINNTNFNIDPIKTMTIDDLNIHFGYYMFIFENTSGLEEIHAGAFQASLKKESDGYYRFLTWASTQITKEDIVSMIFYGKW